MSSPREDYLTRKITTKLASKAQAARITSRAQDLVTEAVRGVDCPVERAITLQEIVAAAVTVRCHDGQGAEAGAHCALLAKKAYAAAERVSRRRIAGVFA